MADIFLSHERTDRQRVMPLVALLEACGRSVWWDQGRGDLGEAKQGSATELAAAGCVVAVWSVDALESPQVRAEADEGLRRGILVSVQVDISTPPLKAGHAPSIGLAGWDGDARSPRAQELIGAVDRVLGRDVVSTEPAEPLGPVATPVLLMEDDGDDAAGDLPIEEDDTAFELPRALVAQAEQRPHWERIKDSDDPNELWAFVVAYPTGGYAEAAWERLQQLGLTPRPPGRFGRSVVLGLLVGLAVVVPATLWLGGRIGGQDPWASVEDFAVKVGLSSRSVTVTAPPRAEAPRPVRIEDLLAQTTPRVERLLARARTLIVAGDICGARAVLQVSETGSSGSLSFLMAETYDPNVLPAAYRGVADRAQARAFYTKARELGYGRAQPRLDALEAAGDEAGSPPQVAATACAPAKAAG